MTINQIFSKFPKVFKVKIDNIKYLNIKGWGFLFYSFLIFLMFLTVVITFDYIKGKKQEEIKNFNTVVKSKEFLNLGKATAIKILESPEPSNVYQNVTLRRTVFSEKVSDGKNEFWRRS